MNPAGCVIENVDYHLLGSIHFYGKPSCLLLNEAL